MLKTTFIGLAVVASLSLGALSPALAVYGHCVEQPDAADCRTYNMPGLPPAKTGGPVQKPIVHAHNHHYYAPHRA
jgi:hypothetical protein